MKPHTIFIAILCVLLLLLQYKLWFSDSEFRQFAYLKAKVSQITEKNEGLLARNEVVAAEVKNLKDGEDAIEEHARNDLGLIRADETFYQILE